MIANDIKLCCVVCLFFVVVFWLEMFVWTIKNHCMYACASISARSTGKPGPLWPCLSESECVLCSGE